MDYVPMILVLMCLDIVAVVGMVIGKKWVCWKVVFGLGYHSDCYPHALITTSWGCIAPLYK
jgi:hypothetical protein